MNIAQRIKQLRQERHLTVNKLANIAGLSQSFVRSIELEEKIPTIESLSLICDALNISLSDFFLEIELYNRKELLSKLDKNISKLSIEQLILLIKITDNMI